MSKFKHDVYAFSLKEPGYEVYKTMYLYDGNQRMAEISRAVDNHGDRINATFLDDEFAVYFDGLDETISVKGHIWLKSKFTKNFVSVPAPLGNERKWLDLAR